MQRPRRRIARVLGLVAFGAVVLWAGVLLMLWCFQEQIVFQPPRAAPARVDARQVRYRATDGTPLFAYVVGNCAADSNAPRTVMLAFHGNADVARWLVPWAHRVADSANVCVVLPEYRGYDGLAGTPSYAASELDARAALAYVRDTMHVPPARTVYFGHSLGSAIAAELAAADPPRSLVLQSPFSSARAMAQRLVVPGLSSAFWSIISRVHFNTLARVRSLTAPVWVAHGDRDIIIPVRMGRAVFQAAAERGELLIVHGAGHNDVPQAGGEAYWRWLEDAVRGVRDHGVAPVPSETSR